MRRVHPLWRGFWLAVVLVAAQLLMVSVDALVPYRLDRGATAWALSAAAGGFLAALPSRLKRRTRLSLPRFRRCLICFFCGAVMALGCAMAGTGRILPALTESSIGALGFAAAAALTAFITARIAARRVRA